MGCLQAKARTNAATRLVAEVLREISYDEKTKLRKKEIAHNIKVTVLLLLQSNCDKKSHILYLILAYADSNIDSIIIVSVRFTAREVIIERRDGRSLHNR